LDCCATGAALPGGLRRNRSRTGGSDWSLLGHTGGLGARLGLSRGGSQRDSFIGVLLPDPARRCGAVLTSGNSPHRRCDAPYGRAAFGSGHAAGDGRAQFRAASRARSLRPRLPERPRPTSVADPRGSGGGSDDDFSGGGAAGALSGIAHAGDDHGGNAGSHCRSSAACRPAQWRGSAQHIAARPQCRSHDSLRSTRSGGRGDRRRRRGSQRGSCQLSSASPGQQLPALLCLTRSAALQYNPARFDWRDRRSVRQRGWRCARVRG
jgi:hypothetical protein